MLDKTAFLAALRPSVERINVEGFGPVNVKQLTVAQTDAARKRAGSDAEAEAAEFGLALLVAAVVDDDGAQVLTDADLPALRESGGAKIEVLLAEVLRVNGLAAKGADEKNG